MEIINLKEEAKTLNYLTENNILKYSQLQMKIKEKDRLYQEYGKLKNQVKQLDAIKQNVDKILNVTGREPRKEKSRGIDL